MTAGVTGTTVVCVEVCVMSMTCPSLAVPLLETRVDRYVVVSTWVVVLLPKLLAIEVAFSDAAKSAAVSLVMTSWSDACAYPK